MALLTNIRQAGKGCQGLILFLISSAHMLGKFLFYMISPWPQNCQFLISKLKGFFYIEKSNILEWQDVEH